MDATVVGDLVGPARRSDATAYRHTDEPARSYTYDSFCTAAWQTANLMRLYGVHEGSTVGIVDATKEPPEVSDGGRDRARATPIPAVVLGLFGASMLGSAVTFDPNGADFEGAALLCPAAVVDDVQVNRGCTVMAYGGPHSDPSVVHFEGEVWSETPIKPPEPVSPDRPVLATATGTYSHEAVLSAGRRFVENQALTATDAVGIEASLTHPGTVAGGVIAPLLVGATIQVGSQRPQTTIGENGIPPESIIPAGSA